MARISVKNMFKSYEDKEIFADVSFDMESGFVALMGESGTGKTTLLRLISGLEKPDRGSVEVEGKIAFVFANPNLFDSVNVLKNVTCSMDGKKSENEETAREILKKMGLENEVMSKPSKLSTGMAQRVSIARAVASNRDIYLLDEPFRGLDEKTRGDIMEYLKEFLKDKIVIMVTHDPEEAAYFTNEIYKIDNKKTHKTS